MNKIYLALGMLISATACDQSSDGDSTCDTANFTVDTAFEGSRAEYCRITSDDSVTLLVAPEDQGKINDSPWYAFRLDAKTQGTAKVTLQYTGGDHRYWPRMSIDGTHWSPLSSEQVEVLDNKLEATLTIPLEKGSVWIAGQELLTSKQTEQPIKDAVIAAGGTWRRLGLSHQGRSVNVGEINHQAEEWVLLVGRQHPPEIAGTLAMQTFFRTIAGNNPLAQRFRQRFAIAIVPVVNPDGVAGGHWRHNALGADLNRDWGPFDQPETRLVKMLIDRLDRPHRTPRLFLDFHSTNRNVLYTQTDDEITNPPRFAARWLAASQSRLGKQGSFQRVQRTSKALPTSKNYMYQRFGMPAITFELGDHTERQAIHDSAQVFAEEMMRILLAEPT